MAGGYTVFNGQGNNLDAYDADPPFATQRVIHTIADDPNGLDINAQICFFPDGSRRFVAGEDTGQTTGDLRAGASSSSTGRRSATSAPPRSASWCPPTRAARTTPRTTAAASSSDGRIVTTDVGNQAAGAGDGQLIVWFPPFDTFEKIALLQDRHRHRNGPEHLGRRSGPRLRRVGPTAHPTAAACGATPALPDRPDGGRGAAARRTAPARRSSTQVRKEIFIPSGDERPDLTRRPGADRPGGLYVSSSVINGRNQRVRRRRSVRADDPAAARRRAARREAVLDRHAPRHRRRARRHALLRRHRHRHRREQHRPGRQHGTVRRIPFVDGQPQPPETMATGLAFPDGIGILTAGRRIDRVQDLSSRRTRRRQPASGRGVPSIPRTLGVPIV